MFDVGLGEILVIAVVALLIFGPDRLPKALAKGMRTWREFRTTVASARNQLMAGTDFNVKDLIGEDDAIGLSEATSPSPRGNKSTKFDPEST